MFPEVLVTRSKMGHARVLLLLALLACTTARQITHPAKELEEENSESAQELEEDVGPALLLAGKIAGDLAIEWTAGILFDFATKSGGDCVVQSPKISSLDNRGVGKELIRNCPTRDVTFHDGASDKKYFKVFGQHWSIFKECEFKIDWEFAASGEIIDCTPQALGEEKVEQLKSQYMYQDRHFTKYIDGLQINVLTPKCNLHNGYVKVYPSLPEVAFREDPGQDYADNPVFYINVELWTGGECSGSKKPGVRWVFTYRVDPIDGKVRYISKFDSNNRPYVTEPSYVKDLEDKSTHMTKKQVITYEQNTPGYARYLGLTVED